MLQKALHGRLSEDLCSVFLKMLLQKTWGWKYWLDVKLSRGRLCSASDVNARIPKESQTWVNIQKPRCEYPEISERCWSRRSQFCEGFGVTWRENQREALQVMGMKFNPLASYSSDLHLWQLFWPPESLGWLWSLPVAMVLKRITEIYTEKKAVTDSIPHLLLTARLC